MFPLLIKLVVCILALFTLDNRLFQLAGRFPAVFKLSGHGAPCLGVDHDSAGLSSLLRWLEKPPIRPPRLAPPGLDPPEPGPELPHDMKKDTIFQHLNIGTERAWRVVAWCHLVALLTLWTATMILAFRGRSSPDLDPAPSCPLAPLPPSSLAPRLAAPPFYRFYPCWDPPAQSSAPRVSCSPPPQALLSVACLLCSVRLPPCRPAALSSSLSLTLSLRCALKRLQGTVRTPPLSRPGRPSPLLPLPPAPSRPRSLCPLAAGAVSLRLPPPSSAFLPRCVRLDPFPPPAPLPDPAVLRNGPQLCLFSPDCGAPMEFWELEGESAEPGPSGRVEESRAAWEGGARRLDPLNTELEGLWDGLGFLWDRDSSDPCWWSVEEWEMG
nr:PREDICTED: proline-rich protein 36-like [Lepisosteus oculatus]